MLWHCDSAEISDTQNMLPKYPVLSLRKFNSLFLGYAVHTAGPYLK